MSCNIFERKRTQKCHRSKQFCGWSCKKNLVAEPLLFMGGAWLFQCFLVLHKILKGPWTPHLKKPSWHLFGLLGPRIMHGTYIFTVFFCLQEQKKLHLYMVLGSCESKQDPRWHKKQHFTCICTRFLHLGWKGEWVKEWNDPGVKKSWRARSSDFRES